MEKAHHGGKRVHSTALCWRRHTTDFFAGGGGLENNNNQSSPELPIDSFFMTDSRRIYSSLQTSSARCLWSSTAGAQFGQIEIIDGTDAVWVISPGERKKITQTKRSLFPFCEQSRRFLPTGGMETVRGTGGALVGCRFWKTVLLLFLIKGKRSRSGKRLSVWNIV